MNPKTPLFDSNNRPYFATWKSTVLQQKAFISPHQSLPKPKKSFQLHNQNIKYYIHKIFPNMKTRKRLKTNRGKLQNRTEKQRHRSQKMNRNRGCETTTRGFKKNP